MTDCCCGNPEGTNTECERCLFIAQVRSDVKLIRDAYNHIMDLRSELTNLLGTQVVISAVAMALEERLTPQVITTYVSPEDQKRNDAMERGDYLRDRAKDEKEIS